MKTRGVSKVSETHGGPTEIQVPIMHRRLTLRTSSSETWAKFQDPMLMASASFATSSGKWQGTLPYKPNPS